MQDFKHLNAKTFDEAAQALSDGKSKAIAGGSDLLTVLRTRILPTYPETVVNIKSVEGAEYIRPEDGCVKIGALTKLKDIEASDLLDDVVKEAAHSVASPLVRNKATIGGNICQDVRCWFYRYPEGSGGMLDCARKGGAECYALKGDNRFHSIFGGMKTNGHAGCSGGCPNNTDIAGYMEKLRQNDWDGAAEILMRTNPMPAITSRVCAHPCQDHCNRCTVPSTWKAEDADDSVSIHTVERAVGDYIMAHRDRFYQAPAQTTGVRVALVGAGPAGLAAAYYLRKAGMDVTVFEKMEQAGGMLRYAIPNYRLPQKYVDDLVSALEAMGVVFKTGVTIGEDIKAADLEKEYHNVFFATGAWKRPVLGFDGEEFTEFGLQFLIEVNQWMNKKEREHVLVVGGGNVAMDVAVTAKCLGAKSVTLACLEAEAEMPASKEEIGRAREEGIQIMPSWGVKRAIYDGKKVAGMELKRCTAVRDESGRFNPQYDEEETVIVNADSILMAAGQKVDLSFLEDDGYSLALDRGLVAVEEGTQVTNRANVYAGGDMVSGPSTVVAAIRQGRNAAESINTACGVAAAVPAHEGFLRFDPAFASLKRGVKDITLPVSERSLENEDTATIDTQAAEEEARRCMNCGCYSVNASDISPALLLLDADIVTTKKTIPAADFFTTSLDTKDLLDDGELVTEIVLKPKQEGAVTHYEKFRIRNSLDFAIVSLASSYRKSGDTLEDVKLVLGGVAPVPVVLTEVNAYLRGKQLTDEVKDAAAELAVKNALPLQDNAFKVQEVRAMVHRFLDNIA